VIKNKILLIILCFAVMLSMAFYVQAEEETAAPISFETQVMRGLSVVDVDFETNPDDELTRGDFIRILMEMIGAPKVGSIAEGGFKDVSGGESYADAVIYANSMGYINGYGDGKFHAERGITPAEAVTVILRVAGYDTATIHGGGYLDGYLSAARDQDMLDGVLGNINQPITKKDAATLLYNTLDVEIYTLSYLENQQSISKDGTTFMEKFMSLARVRDIVTSTYVTSLTGEAACLKEEISIGEVNYINSYARANEHLGYRVEAYIKDEDDETKLIFAIPYKTDVLEIKGEDIDESSTNTNISYESEGNSKLKKVKIEADADKIVNGVAETILSLKDVLPVSDTVILIDNDDDGVAEVVIIYAYEEMYVSSVSVSDEIIYGKYSFDGARLKLELEDADEVIVTKGETQIGLNDIKVDNLITIISTKTDDREIIRINVSDKKVSGVVTDITRGVDQGNDVIYIDNEKYKLSDLYLDALAKNDLHAKKIEVGMSGTFLINSFGRISVVKINSSTMRYGFVKKAYIDEESIDNCVRVRILGTDGDWQYFEVKDKVKLNGQRMKSEMLLENSAFSSSGKAIPQMIEFKLNGDSKITEINTAEESTGFYKDDFIVTPISGLIYRTANKSFSSRYYISGNTVTFTIPSLKTGGRYTDEELARIDEKYFVVSNGPVYGDWNSYDLKLYNADKFGETPLIVKDSLLEDAGVLQASGFLFNKLIYSFLDDEDHPVIEGIHGTNISASVVLSSDVSVYDFTYTTDENGNSITDINQRLCELSFIKPGDLLALYLDVEGYAYRVDVVYRHDKETKSKNNGTLHENEVYVYGYVTDADYDRGFFLVDDGITDNDGNTIEKRIKLEKSKTSVYRFHSESRGDRITVGNINDIQVGDYVMLRGGQSTFRYVVIYK